MKNNRICNCSKCRKRRENLKVKEVSPVDGSLQNTNIMNQKNRRPYHQNQVKQSNDPNNYATNKYSNESKCSTNHHNNANSCSTNKCNCKNKCSVNTCSVNHNNNVNNCNINKCNHKNKCTVNTCNVNNKCNHNSNNCNCNCKNKGCINPLFWIFALFLI